MVKDERKPPAREDRAEDEERRMEIEPEAEEMEFEDRDLPRE